MVAPDNSWTILDDLAFQLCPEDIPRGREQIRDALADCERWIDRRIKWLNRIRWTAIGTFMSSLATISASAIDLWPSDWTSDILIGGSALVWGLCVAMPVWIQKATFDWSSRAPLNDSRLAPLKAYLEQAAKAREPLHDQDGNAVKPDFLLTPWAVLLFSEREEIRRLPTTGSKGLRRVRHAKWLKVEKPHVTALPQIEEDDPAPLTIMVDRSVTNIDRRTQNVTIAQHNTTYQTSNHFEFVSRIAAQADAVAGGAAINEREDAESIAIEERWPCVFDDRDFDIRLEIFEANALCKARPSVKPHQIRKYVIAVLSARRIWLANPQKDIADVAEELGVLIASNTNGMAGLGKTHSIDWIKSVIGGTGNYAFVRRVFAEISYDPAEYDDPQYRLLL